MSQPDLNTLCRLPGAEGSMWRLVKAWDPNKAQDWLKAETAAMVHPHHASRALANVMAAVTFGFGLDTSNLQEAVVGPQGVVRYYQMALQAKVDRHRRGKTETGLWLPTAEDGDFIR